MSTYAMLCTEISVLIFEETGFASATPAGVIVSEEDSSSVESLLSLLLLEERFAVPFVGF